MDKLAIARAIEGTLEERGCFLVEVSLNAYNDIEIVIEKADGVVDLLFNEGPDSISWLLR